MDFQPVHATRVSRFRVLAAGFMLEMCGGSIYIISLYLHELEKLWFPDDPHSLTKIESLVFMSNLGNCACRMSQSFQRLAAVHAACP